MPSFSGSELATWTGGRWEPSCPQHVNGVSTDTRTLVRGNLYIALKGKTMDGGSFVAQAAAKGAAGAVVTGDHPLRGTASCPLLRVGDTLAAMQSAAVGYRRNLGVEVVGVTGSAGKTTVKEMIADVLSAINPVARTMGNFNNEIGVPMSLLAMERDTRIGVFEVGTNHPGELAPLCAMIAPKWGVVTNIGPVHLEFFGSIEGVAAEKSSLLKALPADGSAVLCSDDAFYTKFKSLVRCRVVDVSMLSGAEISFSGMTTSGQEVRIVEKSSGEEFCFRPSVPGDHNICNAMMAIAVGRGHGMGWQDIRRGIEKFVPQPMRWVQEKVAGVTMINDAYNANPMSMRAAVDTFARLSSSGRKWLVVGGMLELGLSDLEFHRELGMHIGKGEWAGLLTIGDRGSLIADGARSAGFSDDRIIICKDNIEAAQALFQRTRENDMVLLKASRGFHIEEVRNQYVLLAL